MNNPTILDEIMVNARQIPLECQERILDILKGMAFTKKCIVNDASNGDSNGAEQILS